MHRLEGKTSDSSFIANHKMIEGLFARSKWRSGKPEPVLSILYNLAELLRDTHTRPFPGPGCTGFPRGQATNPQNKHFMLASSYLQRVRRSTHTALSWRVPIIATLDR